MTRIILLKSEALVGQNDFKPLVTIASYYLYRVIILQKSTQESFLLSIRIVIKKPGRVCCFATGGRPGNRCGL
jgi:hypothetical protein